MIFRSPIRFSFVLIAVCMLAGTAHADTGDYQTLNSGWLLETARNVILTSEPWLTAGCDVVISSTPADITVYREGRLEVAGTLERTPNGLRDIAAVSVEVYVDGEFYMRFDPSPWLDVTVSSWTASRDIDRREILTEADVVETAVAVLNLPSSDLCESLDEIIGMAARMNIQNGRIIIRDLLELPTMVLRGETVMVVISLGSTEIVLNGTALDSGAVGDEIRIRNPDTDRIITATVTGPSRAGINLII